jgi:hypothetical protein
MTLVNHSTYFSLFPRLKCRYVNKIEVIEAEHYF